MFISYIGLLRMQKKVWALKCSKAIPTLPAPASKTMSGREKDWLYSWQSHTATVIYSANKSELEYKFS